MTWHSIGMQLRGFPWAALVWQLQTLGAALLVWQLTKHHYAREWERWAPEKARDELADLRRQLAEETAKRQAAEHKVAKLRGMIYGASARLDLRSHEVALVEGQPLRAVRR